MNWREPTRKEGVHCRALEEEPAGFMFWARGRPGSFSQLRLGQSRGLPQTPPAFTLMASPRTLSSLALSTFPAALVQTGENYGQVAILRTQAGLTSCPVSSLLAQPRAAWENHGKVASGDFQECPMQGRTPGLLSTKPPPVAFLWVHRMGWGRKRKQTPWEWGCGACRLWNSMRNLQSQQRKFCFWNLEFNVFHTQRFCD